MRKLLNWLGFNIQYVHAWGTWSTRYNGQDAAMCRPIHPNMSVAPPSAKRIITRK